jgi:hypothetical protein
MHLTEQSSLERGQFVFVLFLAEGIYLKESSPSPKFIGILYPATDKLSALWFAGRPADHCRSDWIRKGYSL